MLSIIHFFPQDPQVWRIVGKQKEIKMLITFCEESKENIVGYDYQYVCIFICVDMYIQIFHIC